MIPVGLQFTLEGQQNWVLMLAKYVGSGRVDAPTNQPGAMAGLLKWPWSSLRPLCLTCHLKMLLTLKKRLRNTSNSRLVDILGMFLSCLRTQANKYTIC